MLSKEGPGVRIGGMAWLRGWHGQLRSLAMMRKMPLVLAFALMVAAATPLLFAAKADAAGLTVPACGGSGADCGRLLRLPVGTHQYLKDYKELFRFFFGPRGIVRRGHEPWATVLQKMRASPKAMAAFRGIETAVLRGCRPDALYKRVLRTLQLNGSAEVAGKNSLGYCSLIDRLRLAYLYGHVAAQFAREGKKHRAYDAYRCCLFLLSQEVAVSRLIWCNPNPVVVSRYGMPPSVFKSIRAYNRRVYAGRLRFDKLLAAIPTIHRRGLGTGSLTAAIAEAWSTARGNITWQYQLLRSMRVDIERASIYGRARALKLLRHTLMNWQRGVAADSAMCSSERKALLRWIKETMGP